MNEPGEILGALQRCDRILISVHKSPDGDALGSQLALMQALEKLGKTVIAHNFDPVPEIYAFLPGSGKIRTGPFVDGRFDALVVLDCEPQRTGLFDRVYPADILINIDHHLTNPLEWRLSWLDPSAAATGEMVYDVIKRLTVPFDSEIGLCLYTSIFTDTGSFRYSNTTSRSLRIAAEMVDAGADPWIVTENVYESFAFRRLKLLGSVLAGLERNEDGRIAWVVVTDEMFRLHAATTEDTEHFVNFVRSIKGVEVAVLFRQTASEQYKISLRSKGRVDVARVAKALGGGGHENAAGATLDGPLIETKSRVIGEVQKAIIARQGSRNFVEDGRST